MPAPPGKRAAIVTTRVASEPVEALEGTLQKMAAVTYPHDSYLLDEENNPDAKAACEKAGRHPFFAQWNAALQPGRTENSRRARKAAI